MAWEVEYTDQFGEWFAALDARQQESVVTAVEVLQDWGSGLGRPMVDTIQEIAPCEHEGAPAPAWQPAHSVRIRSAQGGHLTSGR
jgi:hypothetical protein